MNTILLIIPCAASTFSTGNFPEYINKTLAKVVMMLTLSKLNFKLKIAPLLIVLNCHCERNEVERGNHPKGVDHPRVFKTKS